MRSKIHLIRHGKTEGNEKGWYYGQLDIPLIYDGVRELQEKKEKNFYPRVTGGFFTSGMKRTLQTLEILFGNVESKTIEELSELRFGIYEGKTYDEIKDEPEFDSWVNDESGNFAIPGGDSKNSFRERVIQGLDKLINYHRVEELKYRHKDIVVESICVCHGGVIGCIMNEIFPGEREFLSWIPSQGEGFTLFLENGSVVGFEEIKEVA